MGKLDEAEKYIGYFLDQLSDNLYDISRCYHVLGILAFQLNQMWFKQNKIFDEFYGN